MSAEPKPSDKTSPVPVGPAAREATPPEWEPEDPLWMTVMPEDVDSNDKLSALHSLIYADTTANERATNFKQQGNDYFKAGEAGYKNAGYWYSRAIDEKGVDDKELLSQCYANRAQCALALGNYGRCLTDVELAVENSPQNIKAYFRGAKAAAALNKLDLALRYCDRGLAVAPDNKPLISEKKQVLTLIEAEKRKEAAKLAQLNVVAEKQNRLQGAFNAIGLQVGAPFYKGINEFRSRSEIFIDSEGKLHFPVLFIYEESHQTDFIQDFAVDQTMADHLDAMFPEGETLPWDERRHYRRESIEVYVIFNQVAPLGKTQSSSKRPRKVRINQDTLLSKVLSHPEYVMPGIPCFYIVSQFYKPIFLKRAIEALGEV